MRQGLKHNSYQILIPSRPVLNSQNKIEIKDYDLVIYANHIFKFRELHSSVFGLMDLNLVCKLSGHHIIDNHNRHEISFIEAIKRTMKISI